MPVLHNVRFCWDLCRMRIVFSSFFLFFFPSFYVGRSTISLLEAQYLGIRQRESVMGHQDFCIRISAENYFSLLGFHREWLLCSPKAGSTGKIARWSFLLGDPLIVIFLEASITLLMKMQFLIINIATMDVELLEGVQWRAINMIRDWSISHMSKGWGSWDCLAWKREGSGEILLMHINTWRESQALFSSAQWQDQRQWTQTETQEVPSEHQETLLYCDGNWALEQVAKKDCGVSILRDTQKLSRHGAGQPALGDPAWAEVLVDQMTSRGPCQPQPFCDFVSYELTVAQSSYPQHHNTSMYLSFPSCVHFYAFC